MAITYSWKVTNLKKVDELEGNTNVVVHARWVRTGVDEDARTGEFQGSTPLRLPEPSGSGTFTDWNDITEAQVIEWVKGEIAANPGYEEHIVQQITKQINAKKNPVVDVQMLPWGVQVAGAVAETSGSAAAAVQDRPRYLDTAGQGI